MIRRIYHPYTDWEDWKNGMWDILPNNQEPPLFKRAVEFTGDHELYGLSMLRVILEWPVSCEQNLTNEAMNRKAWIGHAACSLEIQCPEYLTRRAWGTLSEKQRLDANAKAQYAIEMWMRNHRSNSGQYAFPF